MTARTLYSLRTTANGYIMAKFEDGVTFDHVATYTLELGHTNNDGYTCSCPSPKYPCKHLNMLQDFIAAEAADTDQFYDPKTDSWHAPLQPQWELNGSEPSNLDTLAYSEGLRDEHDKEDAEELAQVLDKANSLNHIDALEATGLNVVVIDENTNLQTISYPDDAGDLSETISRPHPAFGTIKRRI